MFTLIFLIDFLIGFPETIIFELLKYLSIPSYATKIFVAYFDNILLVNPGYEFCSCIKTGIPKIEAIYITGPLAYPPVPTTIFGLCFKMINNECIRLNMILNGNDMFENKLNFL